MKSSYRFSTMIIVLSGLFVKAVGFVARIFISNIVGPSGLGLYQLFLPFYSMVILTLTSGISVAQSKLLSETMTRGKYHEIETVNQASFLASLSMSALAAVLIYLYAHPIGKHFFGDERLILSIQVFSFAIPVIALGGFVKGYFYGTGNVTPTAVGSILEQMVRIGFVFLFARYALSYGLGMACLVLVLGMILGEVGNSIFLFKVFSNGLNKSRKRKKQNRLFKGMFTRSEQRKRMMHVVFKMSLPVTLNRFITSLLTLVELILIKNALMRYGTDQAFSFEEFGRLSGMVMPLILFPMVFTNAISTTLVPAIAESQAKSDRTRMNERISKALLFSIASGVIFTALFMAYPKEIGWTLYTSYRSGEMISVMSIVCIFLYVQSTLSGILNGLEKQGSLLELTLLGVIIRLAAIFFLVPRWGIDGYMFGFIFSSALVCVLTFVFLQKKIVLSLQFGKWFVRPTVVFLVLLLFSNIIQAFSNKIWENEKIATVFACMVLVSLGYLLLFLFRILNIDDLHFLKRFLQVRRTEKNKGFPS